MTVYVDEVPKCCADCEWFTPNHCDKGGRNFCLLARMPFYNTEVERKKGRGQHKGGLNDFDCPLQSLVEHDQQVEKNLIDKMADLAGDYWSQPYVDEDIVMTGDDFAALLKQLKKGDADNGKTIQG